MSPLALSLRFLQAQPDSRLVELARDGHEPAFDALVRRYRKELFAYCRRLQPQTASAEDALQQTLLQAWKALSSGAEVREVRPWLYRIAHNVTLNNLRVAVAVPQEIPEATDAGGHDVAQLVEQRLRARAALAGIASLPTMQRQAFLSTTLEGASHEDVASTLGLSSGAVRGLVYRARATLRAAAAAVTPSPVLHWAMRRAESRAGAAPAVVEALAGGGGAGVAAVIAKGGAVLTLAGAVAGGGVILGHPAHHHRPAQIRLVEHSARVHASAGREDSASPEPALVAEMDHRNAEAGDRVGHGRHAGGTDGHEHHSGSGSRGGPGQSSSGRHDGRSSGGSDGGSSGGSDGGSREGSASGATVASSTSGSGRGGSSGSTSGSDGGSSGGGSTSTTSTSGSNGGTSGGGSGTSGGGQVTTTTTSGGSGSDGGSSGSTTTTTSSH